MKKRNLLVILVMAVVMLFTGCANEEKENPFLGTWTGTLDYTQSLYEQKLVTYPRTDSQYLTEDMKDTAESMILAVQMAFDFGDFPPKDYEVSRVINNSKVTDHHAIIPTAEIQKFSG